MSSSFCSKVSVIIPVFNGASTLDRTLASLIAQSYRPLSALVMDGGSEDGSQEIVSRYPREIVTMYSEPDSGIYDAMNKGIERADGEWLLFLGSDDYFYDSAAIEIALAAENDSCDLLIADVQWGNGAVFHSRFDFRMLFYHSIHHQGVFYRRSIFKQRRYNLRYDVLSDYDLNLKLFMSGATYCSTKGVLTVCGDAGFSRQNYVHNYLQEVSIKAACCPFGFPIFVLMGFAKLMRKALLVFLGSLR